MAFAISTIIAGLGLAVSVGGAALSYSNSQKAAEANSAAARNQEQIAGLQAGNVDTQQQQLALQTTQQKLQIDTQKGVIEDQQKADAIRQQAAELDATRRRREAIRTGIVARAQSLTAATNQGAGQPGSTAVAQSAADISGQTNVNINGVNQNLDVGRRLYAINQDITSRYLGAQDANKSYVDQSQVLQSKAFETQRSIYSLGGSASGNFAQAALYSGNASMGAGLQSFGLNVANAYPAINRITSYFGAKAGTQSYTNFSQPTDI